MLRSQGEPEKPHGAQSLQQGTAPHGAAAELRKYRRDDPNDNAAERSANFISHKILDHKLSEKEKSAGGAAVHYMFSGTTGAMYGVASEFLPVVSVSKGLLFGAAVWIAADEILVPVLGLSTPPHHLSFSKHLRAFTLHLVYGASADFTRRLVRRAL
jgi:hypothetical protein